MHNAGALLPELINSGIRVLIYAGQADSSTSSYLILWYPLTYSSQWSTRSAARA